MDRRPNDYDMGRRTKEGIETNSNHRASRSWPVLDFANCQFRHICRMTFVWAWSWIATDEPCEIVATLQNHVGRQGTKRCCAEFRYRICMSCLDDESEKIISVYSVDLNSNVLAAGFLSDRFRQSFCYVTMDVSPWASNVLRVTRIFFKNARRR